MELLIAAVVVLAVLGLVVGAVTGRVRTSSCCSVADPRRDARMRDAYIDDRVAPTAAERSTD